MSTKIGSHLFFEDVLVDWVSSFFSFQLLARDTLCVFAAPIQGESTRCLPYRASIEHAAFKSLFHTHLAHRVLGNKSTLKISNNRITPYFWRLNYSIFWSKMGLADVFPLLLEAAFKSFFHTHTLPTGFWGTSRSSRFLTIADNSNFLKVYMFLIWFKMGLAHRVLGNKSNLKISNHRNFWRPHVFNLIQNGTWNLAHRVEGNKSTLKISKNNW